MSDKKIAKSYFLFLIVSKNKINDKPDLFDIFLLFILFNIVNNHSSQVSCEWKHTSTISCNNAKIK